MKMYFRKCVFIILVMVSNNLFAQTNLTMNKDTLADKAGWLWEISGNGLRQKSYLFGTCHGDGYNYKKEEIFKFKGLADVFQKVEVIGFEANRNLPLKDYKEIAITIYNWINRPEPKYMMPRGTYYVNLYDNKSQFSEVHKYLSDNMSDIEYWKKKPYYWIPRISYSLYTKSQYGIKAVDDVLYDEALKTKANIIGLDDNKVQLTLVNILKNTENIDKLPLKEQAKKLYQFIHAINSTTTNSQQELTNLYLENDYYKVESYFNCPVFQNSKEANELLLRGRNQKWVPIIEKNISNHSCLFAFGLRHLMGEYSIIKMLRAKGYTIKPII